MKYATEINCFNGEWVLGILNENYELCITVVPGLSPSKEREANELLEKIVSTVNTDEIDKIYAIKDDICGIDAVEIQYEIDKICDILKDVANIIKSKEAKYHLKNAIDRLENGIHKDLESIDTSVELALEKINKLLEEK